MKFRRIAAALLVSILPILPMQAQAVDPTLLAGTVGGGLFLLEGRINSHIEDRINQGFDRFDESSRKIRAHTEAVLASARGELKSILDFTFDELTDQQKTAVTSYFNALSQTEASIVNAIETGSNLVLDTTQSAAALSPLGASPTILEIDTKEPLYNDAKRAAIVVIKGINVGHENNRLRHDGKWIGPVNVRDNEIEFPIYVDFSENDEDEILLTLEVVGKGVIVNDKRRISLVLRSQPNFLGEVGAVYTIPFYPERTRRMPADPNVVYKRGCSGGGASRCTNDLKEPIAPSSGYQILVDTISVVPTYSNRCSGGKGFRSEALNVSPNGFTVYVWAKSSRGRSCRITAYTTFRERKRSPDKKVVRTKAEKFLYADGGVSFELPVNATLTGFYLVRARDGKTEEVPVARMSERMSLRTTWVKGDTVAELVPMR